MSLNNIDFSKKSIVDLYKTTLVELHENIPVSAESRDAVNFKFLGENRKKVLIVVSYPDAVFIPDKQLGFLTTLLAACKFTLADTAVFNFYNFSETDFSERLNFFKPAVVFLFGVEPSDFGMPLLFPHFQIQAYKDSTFLFSPGLEEIEKDKSLKTKLWVCLKKIFNL